MIKKPLDLYRDEPQETSDPRNTFGTLRFLYFVIGGIVMIVAVAVVWGIFQTTQHEAAGELAPDFSIPLLGDDGTFVLSEHRGETVVINFWGSWCGPCREEAPMLQRTYQDYLGRGVRFIGIAVGDTEASALAFINSFGITYPNVLEITGELERSYKTNGIVPQTMVVNRRGEIAQRFVAQPSEVALRQAIEAALDS